MIALRAFGSPPAGTAASRVSRVLLWIVLGFVVQPRPQALSAQEGCRFGDQGNDVVVSQNLPGLGRTTYITRPHLVCAGGMQIWADSAVAYADQAWSHLIGSVRYLEATRELLADEARYFSDQGRLQAQGNVSLRDEAQGSSIRNGDLVYLLQTDFRAQEEVTVTTGSDGVRPVAIMTPPPPPPDSSAFAAPDSLGLDSVSPDSLALDSLSLDSLSLDSLSLDSLSLDSLGLDSLGLDSLSLADSVAAPAPDTASEDDRPPTPYTVVADRIFLLGSGYFSATGTVEIERDSLLAFADSAEYDETMGSLVLEGSARVEGDGYDLTGRSVAMATPQGAGSEIHAIREARLEGDGLLLTSAQIFMFLLDGALERLVAIPIARSAEEPPDSADAQWPEAEVQGFVLTADSLEVTAPGERVDRVFAAGSARSVSTSRDSLNVDRLPAVARSDWLEGDTVIVTFLPLDPEIEESEGAEMDVDEIVARVRARSLYRLPSNDSTARAGVDPPAIHYVMGDEIRIVMKDGDVEALHVSGQTTGVHFEPLGRRPAGDTLAVDTASVTLPDTGAASLPDTIPGAGPAPGGRHDESSTDPRSGENAKRILEVPWNRH
jgi:lipopolysaccharide export system protein LptA